MNPLKILFTLSQGIIMPLSGILAQTGETVSATQPSSDPAAVPVSEVVQPPLEEAAGCWISCLWRDRLEIGVRTSRTKLQKEAAETNFVGSINELKLQREGGGLSLPDDLVVSYKLFPYIGIGYAYDRLRVAANSHYPPDDYTTDGDFVLAGPVLSVYVRIPNPTPLTPYAGIGRAFYSAHFEPAAYWAKGYDTDLAYQIFGPEILNNKVRHMYVDNAIGTDYHVGLAIRIWDGFCVDLRYQSDKVQTEARFDAHVKETVLYSHGPFTVPFDHSSTSLGITYAF